jgi:hypothetical protein
MWDQLQDRIPSPGGWSVPEGRRPAWNWLPPAGAALRLDLMPVWVRVWYHVPFLDRYAHVWMWHHGGWEVQPAPAPPDAGADVPRVPVGPPAAPAASVELPAE